MSETLTIHVTTDEEWLVGALDLAATPAEITGAVGATIAGKTRTTQTHATLYASDTSAPHSGTASGIVERIIRTGVTGIHCTMEFYGKDNPDNPKVYRTMALKLPPGAAGTALKDAMGTVLQDIIDSFEDLVQPWVDRGGQTTQEWTTSKAYLAKVEADIAVLIDA